MEFFKFRYHIAKEVTNFESNETWFNDKLLVESGSKTPNIGVKDANYGRAVKRVKNKLGILSTKEKHIGREGGVGYGEENELDQAIIKTIGNWNPDVMESRYSSKLPLEGMRVMGGHDSTKGFFFIPRSGIDPSEQLQSQIFPFVENILSAKLGARVNVEATAINYLRLLIRLRKVILQDVAVMKFHGKDHLIFNAEPFNSEAFRDYAQEVHIYMDNTEDPRDKTLDTVLPGVLQRMDRYYADTSGKLSCMESRGKRIESREISMESRVREC